MSIWLLVLRGRARAAQPLLDELEQLASAVDPRSPVAGSLLLATNARFPTEEHARARDDALRMVAALREAGSITAQVMPLVVAADCAMRLGHWTDARAELEEAMHLAEVTGQRGPLAQALTMRARLDAACGREAPAREAIARAREIGLPARLGSVIQFADAAAGFLELGLGRVDAALPVLEATAQRARQHGVEEPTQIPRRARRAPAGAQPEAPRGTPRPRRGGAPARCGVRRPWPGLRPRAPPALNR
jgi:hypothetical protein